MKKRNTVVLSLMVGLCGLVMAEACKDMDVLTIGCIFENITSSFRPLGKLMVAVAYLSGIGFFVAAVFKFKQVKDNPTQIPIGTPFALLLVAVLLVFLPGVFGYSAATLFGDDYDEGQSGGFGGKALCGLPGEDDC